MNKRVLFIINRMNGRVSSGHAIWMKGVIEELLKNNNCIDILSDGEFEGGFIQDYPINFYCPDPKTRLTYSAHSTLFQFSDGFNYEKCINYRNALTTALSNHIYDLIICNDLESTFVCHQMELHTKIKVATYAHECYSINAELKENVFKKCYYDLVDKMMFWEDMTTLVQTERNLEKLISINPKYKNSNIFVQPYPLTDSDFVDVDEKDGILFIGRHEDRKSPDQFIKVLADIKRKYGVELKAKVLTRTSHVKKFIEDFKSIGHTNYEIKADVVGEEKAKLIQSAKLAFMPYKNESFGIAVLEALRFMPVVCLSEYNWHYNFADFSNFWTASKSEVSDKIWDLYNNADCYEDIVLAETVNQEFLEYQWRFEAAFSTLLSTTFKTTSTKEPRNRFYSYLQSNKGRWVSLKEYFEKENTKGVIYLTSDIEVLYQNSNWFEIEQTNGTTYVGIKDDSGNIKHDTAPKTEDTKSIFFE